MEKTSSRRIAVAGGGISGLTTAWLLTEAGFDVTVYEALPESGGAIGSEIEDGWLAEKGPNSLLLTNRHIRQLIEGLDLSGQIIEAGPMAKNRYIVKDGKPVALPGSLPGFIRTTLFSGRAKLNLLKEPFISASNPENDPEESLADFVKRRLGQEFLDYAINPFVSGVYAGSPEKLSAKHAFPKLYNLEQKYGSLIRGQIFGAGERKKRDDVSKDRARMISFHGGLAVITDALKYQLGNSMRFESTVTGAGRDKRFNPAGGYENSDTDSGKPPYYLTVNGKPEGPFDKIIYAGHAYDLAEWELTGGINGKPGDLGNIHYPPVTSVTFGFGKHQVSHPLDGFGMLVPEIEPFRILGTLFTSSIFDGRAPSADHATLTTYVGGTRSPQYAALPDDELMDMVQKDLATLLGVKGDPLFKRIYRWPRAIPQYNTGYGTYLESMSRFESDNPGFFILGNFRNGISVPDCIKAAFELAEGIQKGSA